MDSNAKEALNLEFGSAEPNHENLKKLKKKIKIRHSFGLSFPTFDSIHFDFDLIRIKFESISLHRI
jgi:hypothetical protein